MKTFDNILDTIEKLDRLGDPSRNPNPHEARAARERAEALRREWNLHRAKQQGRHRSFYADVDSVIRQYNFRTPPSSCGNIDLSTFVAGFRFYDGPGLVRRFAVGQRVYLVPRPDNPFDALAIAIFWRGHMIGYIPRKKNKRLHRALMQGASIYARISGVFPDAEPWEALRIDVVAMPRLASSRKRLAVRGGLLE